MRDWFLEFLTILSYSRRTMFAIVLGPLSYMVITLIGWYMIRDFQITGYLAPLSGLVKDKFISYYDKAALGCLVSSWYLAIKLYRKDKKFYRF